MAARHGEPPPEEAATPRPHQSVSTGRLFVHTWPKVAHGSTRPTFGPCVNRRGPERGERSSGGSAGPAVLDQDRFRPATGRNVRRPWARRSPLTGVPRNCRPIREAVADPGSGRPIRPPVAGPAARDRLAGAAVRLAASSAASASDRAIAAARHGTRRLDRSGDRRLWVLSSRPHAICRGQLVRSRAVPPPTSSSSNLGRGPRSGGVDVVGKVRHPGVHRLADRRSGRRRAAQRPVERCPVST